MLSWVRIHFQHLRRWRVYAERVARAAWELVPGSKVYVIGGVAEGRVTVLSDIDVLVVVPRPRLDGRERRRLAVQILVRAMEAYGLPWDAPVEVHVAGTEEAERYLRGRAVRIEPGDEASGAQSP